MKHLILILTVALCSFCSNAQKNKEATTMKTTEKIDLEYYKRKFKEINNENKDSSIAEYIEKDGTQVRILLDEEGYTVITISPMSFKKEVRDFYNNNYLKEEGSFFFNSFIKIGIWREYDERGYLVKETDEDKKFEKLYLKPENILRWLEREGYIDRQTGKGQEKFVGDLQNEPNISISFGEAERTGFLGKRTPATWTITIIDGGGGVTYNFDAEDGLIISKEILEGIE